MTASSFIGGPGPEDGPAWTRTLLASRGIVTPEVWLAGTHAARLELEAMAARLRVALDAEAPLFAPVAVHTPEPR